MPAMQAIVEKSKGVKPSVVWRNIGITKPIVRATTVLVNMNMSVIAIYTHELNTAIIINSLLDVVSLIWFKEIRAISRVRPFSPVLIRDMTAMIPIRNVSGINHPTYSENAAVKTSKIIV
jgi:hypothetical protein